MKKFLSVAAALALAVLTPGQFQVTLTGRIEKAPADPCDADATHRIACSDVLLKSSTVDLAALEGNTVKLVGTPSPRFRCISLDVESAENAAFRTTELAIFGHRLGRPIVITSFVPPGSTILYFFNGTPGFLPLGDFGTFLLSPLELVFGGSELSIGISVRAETIPNDPNLVGNPIHYQVGYLSLLTFEVGLLNPNCFTVRQ